MLVDTRDHENFHARIHQEEYGLRVIYTETREVFISQDAYLRNGSIIDEVEAELTRLYEASRLARR
jgi:hypothetical protein